VSRRFADPTEAMRRALELAALGIGTVEPNPPVGAVLVDDNLGLIAEGYHRRFGGPHAEVEAIQAAGDKAALSTLFVTLEPCCHRGKTGPCTEAIRRAGIRKVVVALPDPFPEVNGEGIRRLRAEGIDVEVGLLAEDAAQLAAPFLKLVTLARPWVHAKWAMSLDGKIATHTGESRWISNEASRGVVHALRGRMDAVIVGRQTAVRDDPLLTARPPGPRVATRIVMDSRAQLPLNSQLVRTARDVPLLVAASAPAPVDAVRRLQECGAEVLTLAPSGADSSQVDVGGLLAELGRRRFTNVLVEGGARLLGSFFDGRHVDEIHVFAGAKIIGGTHAPSPVAGLGRAQLAHAHDVDSLTMRQLGDNVYISGRLRKPR
jgi:diaminohydroxyphosphoribosylaminopyrimidine deaminase / 5-amino-6-(5-phosphoribosylamino)uracil reductase